MADRRCFHRKILESDQFYKLPATAQSLYVHLCMAADDDGFLNCAASIAARTKTGKADLRLLVEQRFLLKFEEIYVVKHWRVSNSLKNDRTKPPAYPGIAEKIWICQNRSYTDHEVAGCKTLLEAKSGIQTGIPKDLEGNGKKTEENGKEHTFLQEAFETIYAAYPPLRRGSKETARQMFCKTIATEADALLAKKMLEKWKKSEQWTAFAGQYIPSLVNWLDRGLFLITPPRNQNPGGIWGASGQLGEAELEAIRSVLEKGEI